MNARTVVAGFLTSGVILGTGVGLGAAAQQVAVSTPATDTSGAVPSGAGAPAVSTGAATDGTYTGQPVSTRFGDVQVQVTVAGGRITEVTALHLTDRDGRSAQISNRAAPILREQVLSAQSADVQMVSGATYTSEAYLGSLQSALDQAGL